MSTRAVFQWGGVLVLYSSLLLFSLLGYVPIYQVSEGREGVVVNEILSSGEWVLPLRNGEIVPSKPILFHWADAFFATVAGGNSEFILRLPSAVAGLGMILVVFWFLSALSSPATACLGGLLLLGHYGFFHLTQDGRVDMLFSFFVVWGIAVWVVGAHRVYVRGGEVGEISHVRYLGVGVLAGLACLTKGPLGIVLPALTVGLLSLLLFRRRWYRVLFQWGWLVALFIPLPWYALATLQGEQAFVGRQLVFENLSRFVGGEGISVKPFWFYIPRFVYDGMPWSIVFLAYLYFLVRGWIDLRRRRAPRNAFLPTDRSARFGILAGLIWFFGLLVFFSLSAGKRSAYLLPLYPAVSSVLALRLAVTWERLRLRVPPWIFSGRVRKIGLAFWGLVVGVGLFIYSLKDIPTFDFLVGYPELKISVECIREAVGRAEGKLEVFFLTFAGGTLGLWLYSFRRRNFLYAVGAVILLCHFVIFIHVTTLKAIQGATHTYRPFAEQVRAVAGGGGERIRFIKTRRDESFDGFFFYFREHVQMVLPSETPTDPGLYLARQEWLDSRRANIPLPIWEIAVGGRLIDPPEKHLVLYRLAQ